MYMHKTPPRVEFNDSHFEKNCCKGYFYRFRKNIIVNKEFIDMGNQLNYNVTPLKIMTFGDPLHLATAMQPTFLLIQLLNYKNKFSRVKYIWASKYREVSIVSKPNAKLQTSNISTYYTYTYRGRSINMV